MSELDHPIDFTKLEKQAEKLHQSMRIRTWYNFIVRSGVDLQTIRLKPRGVEGRDTYRRWNHWKNGNGTVKEDDLTITEKKCPGTRIVFDHGPYGYPLWASLNPSINPNKIDEIFFTYVKFPDDVVFEANELPQAEKQGVNLLNVMVKKYRNSPITQWYRLTYSVLVYRTRMYINSNIPMHPDEEHYNETIQLDNLRDNAKRSLLVSLKNIDEELIKFGLHSEDFLNYFSTLEK